jgi:hypothetical protein
MTAHQLTLDACLHVCRNMRDEDRRGIEAAMGKTSAETFAVNRYQSEGPAWFIEQDGAPVCIFGIQLQHDKAGIAWMVCANNMRSFKKLIRFSRTVADNAFKHAGMRRIEACTLVGWEQAKEFAKRLGMDHEGTRRQVGTGGESFHIFARVA